MLRPGGSMWFIIALLLLRNERDTKAQTPRDEKLDYVDLWKYLRAQLTEVKNSMFQVVTWVLGFATAILGFVIASCIGLESDRLTIQQPTGMAILSFIGLVIAAYAIIVLFDFGDEIRRIDARLEEARKQVPALDKLLGERAPVRKGVGGLPQPCDKIFIVLLLYGLSYFVLWFFGLIKSRTPIAQIFRPPEPSHALTAALWRG